MRITRREPWRAARARTTACALADGLRGAGYQVTGADAAIVGVRVADEWAATLAWRALMDAGIYVNVGLYPAVPRGNAILRLSTTAAHTDEDIEQCVAAFTHVVRR